MLSADILDKMKIKRVRINFIIIKKGGKVMKIGPKQPNFSQIKNQQAEITKKDSKEHVKSNRVDEYIPSKQEASIVYQKPSHKIDANTIEQLKAESEKNFEQLRNLIEQLLQRQGLSFKEATNPDTKVIIDDQARVEAQAAISDDGPLSPEKVSDRIVAFAKAISGGDKEKLGLLRDAIDEGFQAASEILGGTLPEISQQTHDLITQKLDEWENGE